MYLITSNSSALNRDMRIGTAQKKLLKIALHLTRGRPRAFATTGNTRSRSSVTASKGLDVRDPRFVYRKEFEQDLRLAYTR